MGVPPVTRVGKIQRRIARAFVESNGAPLLTTIHLLEHSFPRVTHYESKHFVSVYRAASKFAVRVSRPGRAVVIWAPNEADSPAVFCESARAYLGGCG